MSLGLLEAGLRFSAVVLLLVSVAKWQKSIWAGIAAVNIVTLLLPK